MPDRTADNLIARRPLLMYFVFSYAFFWSLLISFFIIVGGLLRVDMTKLPTWIIPLLTIIGSWMPSLAAAIVVNVCEGREGVRRLFGMFFQFRLPVKWYLAGFLPLGIALAAAGLYRMFGGDPAGGATLTPSFWIWLLVYNLITGPTGEEPGWRGFALPRLMKRYGLLKASLILGVGWSFWHLPLWLTSGYAPGTLLRYVLFFNIAIISLTFLMNWIWRNTSHSLVPMTITHFTLNTGLNLIGPEGLGLGPVLPLFYWMAGLLLLSVLIVWATGGFSERTSYEKSTIAA